MALLCSRAARTRRLAFSRSLKSSLPAPGRRFRAPKCSDVHHSRSDRPASSGPGPRLCQALSARADPENADALGLFARARCAGQGLESLRMSSVAGWRDARDRWHRHALRWRATRGVLLARAANDVRLRGADTPLNERLFGSGERGWLALERVETHSASVRFDGHDRARVDETERSEEPSDHRGSRSILGLRAARDACHEQGIRHITRRESIAPAAKTDSQRSLQSKKATQSWRKKWDLRSDSGKRTARRAPDRAGCSEAAVNFSHSALERSVR